MITHRNASTGRFWTENFQPTFIFLSKMFLSLKPHLIAGSAIFCMASEAGAASDSKILNETSRIVFVGDSITGQGGGWLGAGYCFQMEAAIKKAHPGAKPQIVALGGSGMGVGSWLFTEKASQTTESMLDVKDVGVKANLDQPADVLVVMLGMNDVLAPYIGGTDADLDKWIVQYRELVVALRERAKPKVTAIATITPYTETPDSYKNRQLERMNQRLRVMAKELDALVLPTGEACWEVLRLGRQVDPDFHVTRDLIHPDPIGNTAVAIGMLRGLGDEASAKTLLEDQVKPGFAKMAADKPTISYEVVPQTDSTKANDPASFVVHYWWTPTQDATAASANVKLIVPTGWSVTPESNQGASGSFTVKGKPDQLRNILSLEGQNGAEKRRREVMIPAPWRVASGMVQEWKQPPLAFDPVRSVTQIDLAIEKGENFTAPITLKKEQTLTWQRLYASSSLAGGSDPGNVDFTAVTNGDTFEGGYAARWIQSDRQRSVKLHLSGGGLAARIYLTAWLNGKKVYENDITTDPITREAGRVSVEVQLQGGQNTLVIKSNHVNWQWQSFASFVGLNGDDLADLRYSTGP